MSLGKSKKYTVSLIASFVIIIIAVTACSRSNDPSQSQPDDPRGNAGVNVSTEIVPDLVGYSLEELEREFNSIGFTASHIRLVSDEPENTVLFINGIGQQVPVSSTIVIYVSGGSPEFMIEDPIDPDETLEWIPGDPFAPDPAARRQRFEKIEFGGLSWLILDKEEDKVFLLSELVLFDMKYNEELVSTTWETSSIRKYLNNEFFNSFSPEDRQRIALTRVMNGDILFTNTLGIMFGMEYHSWIIPAGNDTDDRIFLLSLDEVEHYFDNDSDRMARMADDHPWSGGDIEYRWWWLRSPSRGTFCAVVISYIRGDALSGYPVNMNSSYIYGDAPVGDRANNDHVIPGVRPALWLYVGD